MKKTGGNFDPKDKHIYFLASNHSTLKHVVDQAKYMLIAVNELKSQSALDHLEKFLDKGIKVFLDSGVYSVAMEHAKKNNLSHNEALRVPLHELEKFPWLYDLYCQIVERFGDRLWGYIEIDLGGKEQKRETRKGLEQKGLRPIPVYHPLNDGWDYFDELAEQYDRIAVGNIVYASSAMRLRIMSMIWQRKQSYPHLWTHLLGFHLHEHLNAYPAESVDSSSWLAAIRWGRQAESAMLSGIGLLPRSLLYKMGEEGSYQKGEKLWAYAIAMNQKNWRNHIKAATEAGLYPSECMPPPGLKCTTRGELPPKQ